MILWLIREAFSTMVTGVSGEAQPQKGALLKVSRSFAHINRSHFIGSGKLAQSCSANPWAWCAVMILRQLLRPLCVRLAFISAAAELAAVIPA